MHKSLVRAKARRPESHINPLIYGHFIEFIRDGISGMWAEMLINRSFEQPGRRPHLAASWDFLTGDVTRAASHQPSPTALRLSPQPERPASAAQAPIVVRSELVYQGSAWIWATGDDITLRAALTMPTGELLGEVTLPLTPEPTRVTFTLTTKSTTEEARLVLSASGSGCAYVDQISLMPADHRDGWRYDVLDLIRNLNPPMIRFPGGCFADVYHWRDGVGERDFRPTRFNHAWKHVWDQLEGNEVGTVEFIELCRHVGCEPLITINFGSAEPDEAAAWVEYCNGATSTTMGRLRAEHGYPEPFGVRLWEIGNEAWGHWEVGNCDAATFARRYLEFQTAMQAVDPGIVLLATGSNANEVDRSWDETVARVVGPAMDYLTLHFYAPQLRPEESGLAESIIYEGTAASALKLAESIEGAKTVLGAEGLSDTVRLAITEWNTMYTDESNRETTLGAAVCNATFLNLFLRQSPDVGMAAFSDLVNGWEGGLIRTGPQGAYGTPSYWAFALYANHGGRFDLNLEVETPTYAAPALGHLPARNEVPLLDVAGTESQDETQRWFFLVNRSLEKELTVAIDPGMPVSSAEVTLLTGDSVGSSNSFDAPTSVVPVTHQLLADPQPLKINLPPHSIARLWVQKGAPADD